MHTACFDTVKRVREPAKDGQCYMCKDENDWGLKKYRTKRQTRPKAAGTTSNSLTGTGPTQTVKVIQHSSEGTQKNMNNTNLNPSKTNNRPSKGREPQTPPSGTRSGTPEITSSVSSLSSLSSLGSPGLSSPQTQQRIQQARDFTRRKEVSQSSNQNGATMIHSIVLETPSQRNQQEQGEQQHEQHQQRDGLDHGSQPNLIPDAAHTVSALAQATRDQPSEPRTTPDNVAALAATPTDQGPVCAAATVTLPSFPAVRNNTTPNSLGENTPTTVSDFIAGGLDSSSCEADDRAVSGTETSVATAPHQANSTSGCSNPAHDLSVADESLTPSHARAFSTEKRRGVKLAREIKRLSKELDYIKKLAERETERADKKRKRELKRLKKKNKKLKRKLKTLARTEAEKGHDTAQEEVQEVTQ